MTPAEIVAARAEFNLNQRDFAELLDVNHSTVVRWENGRTRIPAMLDIAIAGIRRYRAAMQGNNYPLMADIRAVMDAEGIDQDAAIRRFGVLP